VIEHRFRIAMAYQACEVSDLARSAVGLRDPAEAVAQAQLVLAAAEELLAAANRLTHPAPGPPTTPWQLFAFHHPEEAAADVAEWLAIGPCSADHAHGEGRGQSPSTHS
jgi:hypothetical protein